VTNTSYLIAAITFLVAGLVAFFTTPLVKKFAYVIGAVDVPKDNRRMHKTPIPRLGGLAIFFGFLAAVLIFGEIDHTMVGILIGALILVTLGILDDVFALKASLKLVVQIIAALFPVLYGGLRIETLSNFNLFSSEPYTYLSFLSIPITIIWIVGLTNAVNFIDGLDGLAAGVSSIAAVSLLVISCMLGSPYVALVMAALSGAIIGFLPYNLNPAKIFMGDTGSTFLGYILATMSIQGLFKMYAVVSFAVPFLILGLPLFDMVLAVGRRILSGRSPGEADREHVHHKLIDMGFNQKQAVAILYSLSGILGIIAVVLATSGEFKAILLLLAILMACVIGFKLLSSSEKRKLAAEEEAAHTAAAEEAEAQPQETEETPEKPEPSAETPDEPTEESTEPTEESTEPTEESTEPTEESTEPTEESTEPTEEPETK